MYQGQLAERTTLAKFDHLLVVDEDLDLALVHDIEVVPLLALNDDFIDRSSSNKNKNNNNNNSNNINNIITTTKNKNKMTT